MSCVLSKCGSSQQNRKQADMLSSLKAPGHEDGRSSLRYAARPYSDEAFVNFSLSEPSDYEGTGRQKPLGVPVRRSRPNTASRPQTASGRPSGVVERAEAPQDVGKKDARKDPKPHEGRKRPPGKDESSPKSVRRMSSMHAVASTDAADKPVLPFPPNSRRIRKGTVGLSNRGHYFNRGGLDYHSQRETMRAMGLTALGTEDISSGTRVLRLPAGSEQPLRRRREKEPSHGPWRNPVLSPIVAPAQAIDPSVPRSIKEVLMDGRQSWERYARNAPAVRTHPPAFLELPSADAEDVYRVVTRHSANTGWWQDTRNVVQAEPGSHFFQADQDRLTRATHNNKYIDVEQETKRKAYDDKLKHYVKNKNEEAGVGEALCFV
ncbi:hypothetical protein BC832DRAFT_343 [Gaertneriomyces semiglobifer]|nr:hypothetical protein BC832DRAFT_343 [Gaertneriomyces semiglobifer]